MTVANLFAKHRAGEISKEKFLYEVRKDSQLPYINNLTSYDDAIRILKQKSVIKEAMYGSSDGDYEYNEDLKNEIDTLYDAGLEAFKSGDKERAEKLYKKAMRLGSNISWGERELPPYNQLKESKSPKKIIKEARDYERDYGPIQRREPVDVVDDQDDFNSTDYLEFTDGDTVVSLYKDEGKWIEGDVIEGEKPYGWGSKKYMSYLRPKEIARYLSQDYGGKWSSYEGMEESKSPKKIIKEQEYLHLTIDRLNPILVNKAVNVELAKLPEINAAIYQKTLEKVVAKLKKDPRYYDDVFVSNAKEINKSDEKLKMVPVKKEMKDPHHQMKSPKGVEKHKANTKASKTENKKGKPKGVKEMSSHAKGHKGIKQMKQPEKKHKVMEAIESFLKKKLTEDSHHRYGIGMGVKTPDGPGTIKAIVGSTLTVELENGKHKDYQMNIINHFSGHHDKSSNELDDAKIKKYDPKADPKKETMDEKKERVIKKVMEFLKKKKKGKKEIDELTTQDAQNFKTGKTPGTPNVKVGSSDERIAKQAGITYTSYK
jgi:hypothetical protein